MSDLIEHIVNLYHMRLVPTVKRMCARRRVAYTLLTVGVLCLSAVVLSLLVLHTTGVLGTYAQLDDEYDLYIREELPANISASDLPAMGELLAASRSESVALACLGGLVWLILSVTAVGRIMSSVIQAEAYVYGLYMIYGAGQKQLRRQLSTEFLLAGSLSVLIGIPIGYGLIPSKENVSLWALLIILPCFLLLILVCSTVLAKHILGQSCIRMLNAADTTEYTVSPRRSHLAGLSGRRRTLSSAALAMWRMRKHYGSLVLVIVVITALIFGILSSLGQTVRTTPPTFSVSFADGIDFQTLEEQYVDFLQVEPTVTRLDHSIRATAGSLGTHFLVDEDASGGGQSIPLGERYATDSFRIACGDGDTYNELGGQVTIPREFRGKELTEYGYTLEAVPVGGATYVFPEGSEHPLSLKVGDKVRLYLPSDGRDSMSDRVENDSAYITVTITDVEAVGSIRVQKTGEEVCPRITEDYLYLNPLDYELFDGQPHAKALVAEEAYASDVFHHDDGSTCILVVPDGYFSDTRIPSYVTVITPTDPVKIAFHDDENTLPDDTYFINLTAKGTGVYLGTMQDYRADFDAIDELTKYIRKSLALYKESPITPTTQIEYRVEQVIFTEQGSRPYLLLPRSHEVTYSSMQNDICAFRLGEVSDKTPYLKATSEEAFLVETDLLLGSSFFGRDCYIGTALPPAFTAAMKKYGVSLQFPEVWFAHTQTEIGNSFSLDKHYYLLAEFHPYDEYELGYLQADKYPHLVTGTGSFVPIGNTKETSFLSVADLGGFGLFNGESIGRLMDKSVTIESLYVRNDWVITPACEATPRMDLPAGHGIFVTDGEVGDCPIQVGDTVSVSIRADTSELLRDPEIMALSGNTLLAYLLEKVEYDYASITVDEVRHGEQTELILAEGDLAAILGQTGAYAALDIFLSPSAGIGDYLRIYADLAKAVKQTGETATMTYHQQFITDSRVSREDDLAVLHQMGLVAIGMLPLLLLAAQFVFFEKRAEEYDILRAIGQTPRQIRAQFTAETGLTAVLLVVAAAAACPLGHLLFLIAADRIGAAIPISTFDPILYALLLASVAASCLLTGLFAYLRVGRQGSRNRPARTAPTPSTSEKEVNRSP